MRNQSCSATLESASSPLVRVWAAADLSPPGSSSLPPLAGLLFCLLAVLCALYFGAPDRDGKHGTQQLITLNWDTFTGNDQL